MALHAVRQSNIKSMVSDAVSAVGHTVQVFCTHVHVMLAVSVAT